MVVLFIVIVHFEEGPHEELDLLVIVRGDGEGVRCHLQQGVDRERVAGERVDGGGQGHAGRGRGAVEQRSEGFVVRGTLGELRSDVLGEQAGGCGESGACGRAVVVFFVGVDGVEDDIDRVVFKFQIAGFYVEADATGDDVVGDVREKAYVLFVTGERAIVVLVEVCWGEDDVDRVRLGMGDKE